MEGGQEGGRVGRVGAGGRDRGGTEGGGRGGV